jgi:hypothetical protein
MFGTQWVTEPARAPGQRVTLRGAALRARTPTVVDLLLRRIEACRTADASDYEALERRTSLAQALSRWDAHAARAPLARLVEDWGARFARHDGWQSEIAGLRIAEITTARLAGGDPAALSEYAAFVRGTSPRNLASYVEETLLPLGDHADDPHVTALAEALFGDPSSEWAPNFAASDPTIPQHELLELVKEPFLRVGAFRAAVGRLLTNRAEGGRLRVRDGSAEIILTNGVSIATGYAAVDVTAFDWRPLRVCDYIAWKVSFAPELGVAFAPHWSTDRRDAAIAELMAALARPSSTR